MHKLVGTSPAHRALDLIRTLVARLDSEPALVRTFLARNAELGPIVEKARAIAEADTERRALSAADEAAGECYRWCPDCHAQHRFQVERRKAVRA